MKIPIKPLLDIELENYAKHLNISYFKVVFMKDQLPNKIQKNESMFINLNDSIGQGTHWVCFVKKGKNINYFDSFGVKPPNELLDYFASQVRSQRLHTLKTLMFIIMLIKIRILMKLYVDIFV